MTQEQRSEYMSVARRAAGLSKPTKIERLVAQLLDDLGVCYVAQYAVGGYCADFFIPDKMLIVECDGFYWHSKAGAREHDAERDKYLKRRGYKVIRLGEDEIKQLSLLSLAERIA